MVDNSQKPLHDIVSQARDAWMEAVEPERAAQDTVWIEVIRKMDETYADLVRYQVELERQHSALEESQRFISSVLGSMTDVLVVCDECGRIQQVNAALERLVGETEAQLRGRAFDSLLSDPSAGLAQRLADKMRAVAVNDCEVSLRGRDGPVPLAMNCTSRFDHRGRRVGSVLVGRPVGELRKAYEDLHRAHRDLQQAQQQLIRSEKMASLGRLVAGVAHELNNPISFVYGNAHVLQRYRDKLIRYLDAVEAEGLTPRLEILAGELQIRRLLDDLTPLVEGTLAGAERVRDLVQDLRRFSSGQRGEPVDFDLAHVVATAVQWVAKGMREDCPVALHVPPGPVAFRGHPGPLQQVVMNLVQNALDAVAGAPKPAVEVALANAGNAVHLEVRDNGPGIATADLGRIFDPFFTTKPIGEGTGLGLSISYGIVTDHGGQLEAENRPGGGAVFRMILPSGGCI